MYRHVSFRIKCADFGWYMVGLHGKTRLSIRLMEMVLNIYWNSEQLRNIQMDRWEFTLYDGLQTLHYSSREASRQSVPTTSRKGHLPFVGSIVTSIPGPALHGGGTNKWQITLPRYGCTDVTFG